jgi:hypothetical protein
MQRSKKDRYSMGPLWICFSVSTNPFPKKNIKIRRTVTPFTHALIE